MTLTLLLLLPNLLLGSPSWWNSASIYQVALHFPLLTNRSQVYPLSLKDSDGDGYGDLAGLRNCGHTWRQQKGWGGSIFTVAPQGWARHWSTFPLWGLTPSGSLPSSPHPWQTLATTSPTIGGGLKSARMPSFDNILLYIRNEYHIFCDLIVQDNQSNFWYNGRLWYNDGRGKEVDMIWHVCLEWGFCLSNYRSTTNRLLLVHQISKVQPKFCQILWFSGPISVFWIGKTVNFPENKKYYLG